MFGLHWRRVAIPLDQVENGPAHVDYGAMLVEHVLADQAVHLAAGQRSHEIRDVPQVGNDHPALPDGNPVEGKAVDPDHPGGNRTRHRNPAARRPGARQPECGSMILVYDAEIGAGVEHEQAFAAVQRGFDKVMAGGAGPAQRNGGEAEQAQRMVDRPRLARPVFGPGLDPGAREFAAEQGEDRQSGQSGFHAPPMRRRRQGSFRSAIAYRKPS